MSTNSIGHPILVPGDNGWPIIGHTLEAVKDIIEFMDEPGEGNIELLDVDKQAYTQTHNLFSSPCKR